MSSSPTLPPDDRPQKASTLYLYLIVLIAAVGGFLFGYDLSLISGAILFLTKEFSLSPLASGTIVGSATLGCCFGPMMGAWMADAWGRKYTLIFSGVLFLASSVGCAYADSVTSLVIWRFVGGLGVGLASTVSPMYIAEIAPAAMRGRLVVLNQLAIVVGLGMSVLVTYWLSFGEHWRLMFASQLVPVACLMIGLFCVPESPRWLAAVNRIDKALAVLTTINGPRQAAIEISDIQASLKSESGNLRELFRSGVRLALIIGIVLMVFQQINGVNLILLYTPTLFMAAGISSAPDAILNSVFIDGWILLCTIISFWLTRTFGRRPILIVGTLAMAVGHVLMYLNFTFQMPLSFTLMAMLVPTGAFTLTLAPLGWVVISEIFPTRIRGKAMSIVTCIMFAASYIVTSAFPSAMAAFEARFGNPGGAFLIFAGVCLACSWFVKRMLPETKDRTLEEIAQFWLTDRRTDRKC